MSRSLPIPRSERSRWDDASLEGQATLVAREIASVKRALAQIEDGTYGECVRCGEDIARARLEARPEAALLHQLRVRRGVAARLATAQRLQLG